MSKKLTKREHKATTPPNAAVKHNMKSGERIGRYMGRVPKFNWIRDHSTGLEKLVKVSKGIPFVRVM